MSTGHRDLTARFADLTDEALMERLDSGDLTDAAKAVAERELRSRGIRRSVGESPTEGTTASATGRGEDDAMMLLVGHLVPAEAHIVQARLQSEGIHAAVVDTNLGQVGLGLPAAAGGARVLVPAREFEDAKAILAALQSGDYQLADESEVASCPKCGGPQLTAFVPGFFAALFRYSGPSRRLRCGTCGHTWPNSTSSI
jgi:Putative prokaryotic signal transducing protein